MSEERRFVEVGPPYWSDVPVFIIGGGTSLRGFDFDILRGRGITVGVNVAAFLARTDVMFSIDHALHRARRDEIEAFAASGGEVWFALAPNNTLFWPGVNYIERRGGVFAGHPREVHGTHSGFAALNFAAHKRARTVYLLGIDMCCGRDATHWHDEYDPPTMGPAARRYSKWVANFGAAAETIRQRGVRVVNVIGSPRSRVECFETITQADLAQDLVA